MPNRSSSPSTGIILAAGYGSRLSGSNGVTDLKPLTPVAGIPLIIHALGNLSVAGCTKAVIVLGYAPDRVKSAVEKTYNGPLDVQFVVNDRFDSKNGLSVLAARPLVDGPFLLTMSDHITDPEMMEQAGHHVPPEQGATLLVDYKLDTIFDIDDATKVLENGRRIRAIGKQLRMYNCVDTGVFVCTPGLMDALQAVVEEEGDAALSDGIRHLSEQKRMSTLDIGTSYWQDVDTPEMLAHAETLLQVESQAAA